jgi:hypothetical protein
VGRDADEARRPGKPGPTGGHRGRPRRKEGIHTEDAEGPESEVAGVPCPDRKSKELRAEEDGFALEHFDGDKKRGRGVDARGGEDDGD